MELIDKTKLEAFGATCKSQDYMDGVKDTLEYIDNLPTIDAEPVRHGTWRHYERMLTCSECGTVFYDDIMEYFGEEVPRYCPECGARMDL